MLRAGDILLLEAEDYANGEAVGKAEGCTVFVPRLIVGERARVQVVYAKNNVAHALPIELVQPSPARISPPCALFGRCGGCSLAHLRYEEQLAAKRGIVQNALRKIGKIQAEVLPCVPSPEQWGYRNKIALPVRGKTGNVSVGMFERNSHKIVPTGGCPLAGEWATTLTSVFTDYCNRFGVAPYNEQTFSGEVRHLVARFTEGQLLVTVVANGRLGHELQPLAEALAAHFDKFGLFVNVNTLHNNVILGKHTHHVCGLEYIEGEHLGVKFRLRPDSFFQVNDGVKNLIYSKVRELADTSQTQVLADCFSGIGILTDVLASERFDSYAIEIEPSAVRDADDMARLNGTPRLVNICGDVTDELPKIVAANVGKRFTVVVDPPRKGLNETICKTLLQAAPQNIVYISCDPATLARDLAMLADAYAPDYIEPYDMFPQTDQVETVVRLKRLSTL